MISFEVWGCCSVGSFLSVVSSLTVSMGGPMQAGAVGWMGQCQYSNPPRI